MTRTAAALALLVAAAPLAPARAIDFPRLNIFRKKPKEEPPQRARQLVETLKSDPDEKKRVAAAEELRDHDPRSNADVVPALINTLQRDPSPAVRSEAAETLGRLKPVSPPAGAALEQTFAADPAEPVRKAAQQALWQYHLNGYRSAGAGVPQTPEPPLAKTAPTPPPAAKPAALPSPVAAKAPPPAVAAPTPPRPITTGIGRGAVYPQTVEPPLAKKATPPATREEPKPPPVPAGPAVDGAKPLVPVVPPPAAVPTVPPPPAVPTISPPKG